MEGEAARRPAGGSISGFGRERGAFVGPLEDSLPCIVPGNKNPQPPPADAAATLFYTSSDCALYATRQLMSDTTELFLPLHLPYPIKVVAHAVQPADSVQRGTRLLSYSFTHTPPDEGTEVRFGTWDCAIEGTVDSWGFRAGETVSQRKARELPAIKILEPCKHGMQIGGLCCLCGKDMTECAYNHLYVCARC